MPKEGELTRFVSHRGHSRYQWYSAELAVDARHIFDSVFVIDGLVCCSRM